MNPAAFREYDIRGVVGQDLTDEFAWNLGRSVGTYGSRKGVVTMAIGYDCRLTSERFHDLIIQGLVASGIDVVDIGLCATPMLYFAIRHLTTGGGVMITGSHNPPEYNGFKICIGPDTIYGDEIQMIRTIMEAGEYVTGRGSVSHCEIAPYYYEGIFNNVAVMPGFKVVVDGGNGVGGHFALPLLKRFDCKTTPLYCNMDANFPHHFPDPTVEENLSELIDCVQELEADVGIAFDGDADRIGVVTEKGTIVRGDELLVLFSRFVLKEHPGAVIVADVKCSDRLFDDIAAHGGKAVMWKSGHSLIKGKLRAENALLAGEMSSHYFFADRYFGFDDGIYAAARLLEILSKSGETLSSLLADLPESFSTPEIRVECPDDIKFNVVEVVREYFRNTHLIIDIDGVRVKFDDGWGLVRASNTQPALVLRFESRTEEGLKIIRGAVEDAVERARAVLP